MRKVDIPCYAVAPHRVIKGDFEWRPKCSLELCHEGNHENYQGHDLDRRLVCWWPSETKRAAREALMELEQELADL